MKACFWLRKIYQPSEEVMGYLDPYDGVVCIECQLGGDDGLMLLCDICDSPAHTYCVGLGREVPEGNWYCKGCRLTDPGSANVQVQDPSQGTSNSSMPNPHALGINAEGFVPTPPNFSACIRSIVDAWNWDVSISKACP